MFLDKITIRSNDECLGHKKKRDKYFDEICSDETFTEALVGLLVDEAGHFTASIRRITSLCNRDVWPSPTQSNGHSLLVDCWTTKGCVDPVVLLL